MGLEDIEKYQIINDWIQNAMDKHNSSHTYLYINDMAFKSENIIGYIDVYKYALHLLKINALNLVEIFIELNDAERLTDMLHFLQKDDVDDAIKYAIEQKKPESQVILTNYKNKNFEFDDGSIFDQYKL